MSADYAAIKLALRNHALTVSGIPAARAWENKGYTPVVGTPYLEEDFVPATVTLRGLVKGGAIETTGLYVLKWYGLANVGTSDIDAGTQAILDAFPPGSTLALTSGDVVRIRGDVAPSRGQVIPVTPGWACIPVTVAWRLYTQNGA